MDIMLILTILVKLIQVVITGMEKETANVMEFLLK